MIKDGEIGSGQWSHCRWCAGHGSYHGILFPCEKYPPEILQEIKSASHEFKKQIVSEDSFEAAVMREFMGIEKDSNIE